MTQYIPLSIFDLQSCIGGPSTYVLDSAGAGIIVHYYNKFVEMREQGEPEEGVSVEQLKDCIMLASCGPNESLPVSPNLPADVFTSCLTTPIKMAVVWHLLNSSLHSHEEAVAVYEKIPGNPNQRNTPLGELNWIFTAVTESIAYNVLPTGKSHFIFHSLLPPFL